MNFVRPTMLGTRPMLVVSWIVRLGSKQGRFQQQTLSESFSPRWIRFLCVSQTTLSGTPTPRNTFCSSPASSGISCLPPPPRLLSLYPHRRRHPTYASSLCSCQSQTSLLRPDGFRWSCIRNCALPPTTTSIYEQAEFSNWSWSVACLTGWVVSLPIFSSNGITLASHMKSLARASLGLIRWTDGELCIPARLPLAQSAVSKRQTCYLLYQVKHGLERRDRNKPREMKGKWVKCKGRVW